jgi:hypothetical protein
MALLLFGWDSPMARLRATVVLACACGLLTVAATAADSQRPTILNARLDGFVLAVQGTVRSKPIWFDVDSGGLRSIIDVSTARALGLAFGSTIDVKGAGKGSVNAWRLSPVTVILGFEQFRLRDPLALDLSHIGSVIDERGLLGFELFEHYVIGFDYDRNHVTLFDPSTYVYHGNGARIPLVIRPPRAFVWVTVAAPGVSPERHLLRVDTGSSDAVDDDIVLRSSEPKRAVSGGVGIGSRFQTYIGAISELGIGPFILRKDLVSATGGVQLIGSAVWHRFNIVFDFSRACMYLTPRGDYAGAPRRSRPAVSSVTSDRVR